MHTHRAPATYIRMSARVRSRGNIGTTAPSWAPSELAPEDTPAPSWAPEDTPQRCLTSLRFNSTSSEMRSREDWSSRNLVASSEFENGSSAEALKRERLAPDEGGNQTQSDARAVGTSEARRGRWEAISMHSSCNQKAISMQSAGTSEARRSRWEYPPSLLPPLVLPRIE